MTNESLLEEMYNTLCDARQSLRMNEFERESCRRRIEAMLDKALLKICTNYVNEVRKL
jgi:hypothetical protein